MPRNLVRLLTIALAMPVLASWAAAKPVMSRRGWQLATLDEAHVAERLAQAPDYGINEIQLSHDIIYYIDDINDSERVRNLVNDVVVRAHSSDPARHMRVFVWSHELNIPRPPAVNGRYNICLDPQGAGRALLDGRKEAHRRALRACPNVDGVVLMFGSSPVEPWDIVCQCPWCRSDDPAQKAKLIIEEVKSVVVGEFGKELMVRTFIHSPEELRWIGEALRATSGVSVMPKCVPQDWEPYYPHDETIGNVGDKQQVVEFDLAGEYWGLGVIPFCQVEELQYRLQYDHAKGAVGGMGRPERPERIGDVFGIPNEVNAYAFSQLLDNPDQDTEGIWRDWVSKRYGLARGSPAATALIACLRRTFDIGRKMYYVKGFWVFAKNSEVPAIGRIPALLEDRSIALYDRAWSGVEAELKRPTDQTLEEIAQEKCEAIWLSDQSLADLEQARPSLRSADYEDLHRRLTHQRRCTEIWRWVADAIFRYQLYLREPSDRERELIEGDLRKLDALAAAMEQDYGPNIWPGRPAVIRRLIADIRSAFGTPQQAMLHQPSLLLRDIAVESLTPRTAVITWKSDTPGRSSVQYGLTLPAYGSQTPNEFQPTANHRIKLTGLQPGTRYYFRVRTTTEDGREMVSGDFRFQTPGR